MDIQGTFAQRSYNSLSSLIEKSRETSEIPEDILVPKGNNRDEVEIAPEKKNGDGHKVYDRSGKIVDENASEEGAESAEKTRDGSELSEEEKHEVARLKKTDSRVRAHEHAHMAAGGSLVRGGANYEYKRGPDGTMYAVGGEVSIDTSEEARPEDTISKMQRVKAAALAPADPSPQDRKVAAEASVKAQKANMELAQQRKKELSRSQDEEASQGKEAVRQDNENAGRQDVTDVSIKARKAYQSKTGIEPSGAFIDAVS